MNTPCYQLQSSVEHQCLYKILIPQNTGTERKLLVIPEQHVYVIFPFFPPMVKSALILLKKYLLRRALLPTPTLPLRRKALLLIDSKWSSVSSDHCSKEGGVFRNPHLFEISWLKPQSSSFCVLTVQPSYSSCFSA